MRQKVQEHPGAHKNKTINLSAYKSKNTNSSSAEQSFFKYVYFQTLGGKKKVLELKLKTVMWNDIF